MAEHDDLDSRVERIEGKLDALTQSTDARFDTVDARFDGVDRRLDGVDRRLDGIDGRLDDIDGRFTGVDEAIAEQRRYTEFAFDRLRSEMKAGFSNVDARFDRLERKFDVFIDTQTTTNALVERRLQALESRSSE